VEICKYEEIAKSPTVAIFIGGVAAEVGIRLSSSLKNCGWTKTLICDCKEGPGVEVVLDLNIVRKILSSPSIYRQYGVDVPKCAPEVVEKFQEGVILRKDIGSILSFSSEEKIMSETLGKVKLATEEADKARDQAIPVLKKLQFNSTTSLGGGTGSSTTLPHCGVLKHNYPFSSINLITTFDYIPQAIPSVPIGDKIRDNIQEFLEELVSIEQKMNNNPMKFLGFKESIRKRLPDHVFSIVGIERKVEFIKKAAQLNEDLSHGIPFNLRNFENMIGGYVSEKGIATSIDVYEHPRDRVKEYIALTTLREQLKLTIKPNRSKTLICGQVLRRAIDLTIPSIFEEVVDDRTKIEIRSGKINIQELLTKIREKIEEKSIEFKEILQRDFQQFTLEVESIWKDSLDEILDRTIPTMELLDSEKREIEKSLIKESEIEKLENKAKAKYKELESLLKKRWKFRFSRLDELSMLVISNLTQIEERARKKAEQSSKLTFLNSVEGYLKKTQDEVITLRKWIEDFYKKDIVPPRDEFVKIPSLSDLIDPTYKLPSLNPGEIYRQWVDKNLEQIEEKVRNSFKINLLAIKLKNPHEGWETADEHIPKREVKIAIVPDFAHVIGEEHFDYLVKRMNYWRLVVYHFVFNITMKEFLRAFEKKLTGEEM
jgi:hypothetical protein